MCGESDGYLPRGTDFSVRTLLTTGLLKADYSLLWKFLCVSLPLTHTGLNAYYLLPGSI